MMPSRATALLVVVKVVTSASVVPACDLAAVVGGLVVRPFGDALLVVVSVSAKDVEDE